MLSWARASTARDAFQSTSQLCTPDGAPLTTLLACDESHRKDA
jgi:hypothetical protein